MKIRSLFIVLLLAVICLVTLPLNASAVLLSGGDLTERQTYVAIPDDMGNGIYYLDLNATRASWYTQSWRRDSNRQLKYLDSHFDRLVATAIANWARQRKLEIACITSMATSPGNQNETTGLLIVTRVTTTTTPPVKKISPLGNRSSRGGLVIL